MDRLRILLCGLVITLGSCSAPEPPLRVGLLLWPPYELTVLAQHEGWYPEGSVRILEYQSPIQLSRAFRSGQVDVALTTSHISLSLAQDGIDHRIIYVVDHSQGGDALMARPEVESLEGLAGRTVGVEPSPLGMYVLGRVLDRADLGRSDISVMPLDIPQQRSAYVNGRVDAVLTYEPVRSRLRAEGARELFNSQEIPHEIIDVVIARKAVVDARPERLRTMLSGMDRALSYLREEPDSALPLMASRALMDAGDFQLALEGAHLLDMEENAQWLIGDPSPFTDALRVQMEYMQAMGMLSGPVDVQSLVDARFLRQGSTQ